ncbi:MAG: alpha/beta hydrolase [Saprospiraceae bacterium]
MQFPFHYKSTGNGIPFHFQHGLGSNLQQPQALLAGLEKVQLISMDCPGHGEAPLIESTPPSFNHYADQLLALMDELKVEKAIFGGISMGAGISLNVALRYPERVKALVLIRPAWLDQGSPENLAILLEAAPFIGQKNGLATFEQRPNFKRIQQLLPNAAQSVLGVFAPTQRAEIPLVLENMIKDRPFSDLKALENIHHPCLIIGNEDDPLHPIDMAERIHQCISGSQCVNVISRYVDDAQHGAAVNQLVSKFITDL